MTGPAGTLVLCRSFGLPVALSLALHGLAVAALGTFPFAPAVTPVQQPGVQVDLVSLPPQPVVEPVGASSVVPAEPLARSSDPIPAVRELPRVPAPAASPASVFAQAATFAVPEAMESLDDGVSLSVSTGSSSVSRPVAVSSSGGTRLLRDSTAEAESVRSKVRTGNNPRPDYPRAAREAGWEGTVVLQILVLPDGTAWNVTLHKTSGYSILDAAALAAVKGWQFVPAMDGHFPVKSLVRLPIRFDLKAAN